MPVPFQPQPSSYRDPAGFLFYRDGVLYRQVNKIFKDDFDLFLSSGLYRQLIENGLLIPHETIDANLTGSPDWYQTLKPEPIPFISYPYEWCFDMWKDAALATLEAAREAMSKGLMLKDASAYNLQWHRGRMLFLDTLSFERYRPEEPWIAYRQFCEQFLAPLALMHYKQIPLSPLMIAYPDGLPLPMAKKLLPFSIYFNLHTYLHLHLHAGMAEKTEAAKGNTFRKPKQNFSTAKPTSLKEPGQNALVETDVSPLKKSNATEGSRQGFHTKKQAFSAKKMTDLLRSLESAVRFYSFDRRSGVWSGYYEEAGQREDYLEQKQAIIERWTEQVPVHSVIDLGANEGHFSRLVAKQQKFVVSADFDHYAVNQLYRQVKGEGIQNIHPILLDLSHPSPALGLNLEERASFTERAPKGLVLALALIHHLAIGKNIPFDRIATMMRSLGPWLIIEFVPKSDGKVQAMLEQKKDIYDYYTSEAFLQAFSQQYRIEAQEDIGNSGRTLYLMGPHEN